MSGNVRERKRLMTKRFALMLMLLLPLVAGCLTDSGDDDDDSGSTGLSAATYVPLTASATFNYAETGVDNDESYTSEYITTISGPVSKNGKSYYRLVDVYHDYDWPDTSYVRVDGNTLYELEAFWNMAAKTVRKTGHVLPKIADEIEDYTEVPFIKFDRTSWTIYDNTVSGEGYSWGYSWTGKYLRKEDVSVPAGTFQDCPVFELTLSEEGTYTYDDTAYPDAWETTITIWWAANVGWVKSTNVERELDEDSGSMEVYYTGTTVLESYSIP